MFLIVKPAIFGWAEMRTDFCGNAVAKITRTGNADVDVRIIIEDCSLVTVDTLLTRDLGVHDVAHKDNGTAFTHGNLISVIC